MTLHGFVKTTISSKLRLDVLIYMMARKEKKKIKMIKTPVIGCLSIEGSQLYVFPILEK